MSQLEFEKPILELEGKIAELRNMSGDSVLSISDEVGRMQSKVLKLLTATYSKLTPAQKVQVARHQDRPHFLVNVGGMVTDFIPLAGDRNFAEDHAIVGGLGRFNGQSGIIMCHERGQDTDTRIRHHSGMSRP